MICSRLSLGDDYVGFQMILMLYSSYFVPCCITLLTLYALFLHGLEYTG
jgi:hypothetical protein